MMSAGQSVLVVVIALVAFVVGVLIARERPTPKASADMTTTRAGDERVGAAASSSAASDAQTDEDNRMLVRLSQAVDRIEQGVIVCDASGADLFRNRVARHYLEARDGLVLVEAAVRELLADALEGRTVRREVDLFGPPAQAYVISAYPFADGHAPGALALVEDRSLQKRTETVRRDFVANISHELKTPIGALGLLAETIRDEPDGEIVARLAERMITEADRAGCTVDDLLELSRIEFGDDAEFTTLEAVSVLGEAAGRIASAAEHAGISVRTEVSADMVVFGDRRQLVSALFNLLDNAVKYSPAESEIILSARLVEGLEGVELKVADSGVGIPRRDLDRVFERFYRVDRARSRGTGGTGLGLAIVRHVASNHGGDVSVESTEGVGTTFTLTLPFATPPTSAARSDTGDT